MDENSQEMLARAKAVRSNLKNKIKSETMKDYDPSFSVKVMEKVKDDAAVAIETGVQAIAKSDMPRIVKVPTFINIGIVGSAAAISALAVMTMSREDLVKTTEPDQLTRDHMLFAALFAIASETITKEGQRVMVETAEKFDKGDESALPKNIAHRQFELIRGYPFKSDL